MIKKLFTKLNPNTPSKVYSFMVQQKHVQSIQPTAIALKLMYLFIMATFLFSYFCSLANAQNNIPALIDLQQESAVTRLSQVGEPLYPIDFQYPNYVNPNAPKGGKISMAALARGFDNFNPYITRGISPQGSDELFETLTTSMADDPFTIYGLLAEKFKLAPDKKSMTFYLNPKARFHNGDLLTADDVVYSYNILIEKGIPQVKLLLKDLNSIKKLDNLTIRFDFKTDQNKKLPFIIGGLPIYQKKDYQNLAFDEPSLTHIPNATGPYKIGNYDKGRFIEYVRDPNYWGRDLPIKRGQNNFDTIRYEFYFDTNAALEAFKAGQLDIRHEGTATNRATKYESEAKNLHWYTIKGFTHSRMTTMQGFMFNLRREKFQDICVRQAFSLMMDIHWGIKNYSYGAYQPISSFFGNSELEARGKPDAQETDILKTYLAQYPHELDDCGMNSSTILTSPVVMPANPRSQTERHQNLILAQTLLQKSGWYIKNNILQNQNKVPFEFELLVPTMFDRWAFLWVEELKKIGIQAVVSTSDDVQLVDRLKTWNFDSTTGSISSSRLPGEELNSYFGSASADFPSASNRMGLKNKIVDALINKIITLEDRDAQILHTRVLDRVLRSLYFVVPHFSSDQYYVAYWEKFGRPKWIPTDRVAITAALNEWWIDPVKEHALKEAMQQGKKLNIP